MTIENELINAYEKELALAQQQNQGQNNPYATAMFGGGNKQNLIEWELDFSQELEDIERLLRNDLYVRNEKTGESDWIKNPDASKVFLNNLGVNDILRKIRLVVNKNKVLSNYTIDEIRVRVKIIMDDIRVTIYNNYEHYGIKDDDEYKMNNYSSIVIEIGSIIEDAYRRALAGETHKGLNEQRLVTQNEPLMAYPQYPQMQQSNQKKAHWYAPWSWGK